MHCDCRTHNDVQSVFICKYITLKLPIIIFIYKIYKHPTPRENADNLSFPIMYHIVVYTLYSAPDKPT